MTLIEGIAPSRRQLARERSRQLMRTIARVERLSAHDISPVAMVLREAADAAETELAKQYRR